jgi:hypothetical protein
MSQPRDDRQDDLFRPSLEKIINLRHPLRNLRIGSVKKMTTLKPMSLEKLFRRSLHLSYEIGALRFSNLYSQNRM